MSRTFFSKFLNILTELPLITNVSSQKEEIYNKIIICGLSIYTSVHMFYTFGTLKYEMIKVEKNINSIEMDLQIL